MVFRDISWMSLLFLKTSRKGEKMRNSLQKRLSKEGWTGKELSAFFKKHGIVRSWKTILKEIKNSKRVFCLKKVGGYIILSDDTVKKYINFIVRTKKIKKTDGRLAEVSELIGDMSPKTKEYLDEKRREEENKKEIFRGEIVNVLDFIDDKIIARQGLIKTIRRF